MMSQLLSLVRMLVLVGVVGLTATTCGSTVGSRSASECEALGREVVALAKATVRETVERPDAQRTAATVFFRPELVRHTNKDLEIRLMRLWHRDWRDLACALADLAPAYGTEEDERVRLLLSLFAREIAQGMIGDAPDARIESSVMTMLEGEAGASPVFPLLEALDALYLQVPPAHADRLLALLDRHRANCEVLPAMLDLSAALISSDTPDDIERKVAEAAMGVAAGSGCNGEVQLALARNVGVFRTVSREAADRIGVQALTEAIREDDEAVAAGLIDRYGQLAAVPAEVRELMCSAATSGGRRARCAAVLALSRGASDAERVRRIEDLAVQCVMIEPGWEDALTSDESAALDAELGVLAKELCTSAKGAAPVQVR